MINAGIVSASNTRTAEVPRELQNLSFSYDGFYQGLLYWTAPIAGNSQPATYINYQVWTNQLGFWYSNGMSINALQGFVISLDPYYSGYISVQAGNDFGTGSTLFVYWFGALS
jgi:hypothetical protein